MAAGLTEEQKLVQGILQNPQDDAYRLVYADWLEENDVGDGKRTRKAEFIRAQIELEHLSENDPRWQQLQDRSSELSGEQYKTWSKPLQKLGVVDDCFIFRRGFPDDLDLATSAFLKNAQQLFALAPITSVCLEDREGAHMQELSQSPYLARLASLSLRGNDLHTAGMTALAGSAHLSKLQHLDLADNQIDVDGVRALANSSKLTNLRSLDVSNNPVNDDGAQALAESPHVSQLTNLSISDAQISDEGALALAESKQLKQLARLNLSRNNIGPNGARAFLPTERLPLLSHLDLKQNPAIGPTVEQELDRSISRRREAQQRKT